MTSIAAGLARSLPKPQYNSEYEEQKTQQRGPRIVGPGQLDETRVVLKRSGPPPYPNRAGWRPRAPEDFGDGGAFPEIHVAQYVWGKKGATSSNALVVQVDGEGKVDYSAIARQGHDKNRIIHTSFKDLIPLRQRAEAGDLDLSRPSREEVEATAERTRNALATLVSGAVAAQKPKTLNVGGRREPTFVRYTPSAQMGDNTKKQDRIMKIIERQKDPMEPPKFKHKKIPRGPPTPPPPVMHSPPRKLTAEDQEAWKIPPPVSLWKNSKGFTVPLDKRLAADGRGLQDVQINDKFAQFSEALFMADRHAREEVRQRAMMQQRLAEKEKAQKEENLRQLAQAARAERAGGGRRSRSRSYSGSESGSDSDGSEQERVNARKERQREDERKLRQSRMGAERRAQVMAREMNRDISEKIALGLAKPTQSAEGMYDSRLFNQSSGFDSGFNEDNPYDKPLFAAQDAISSIYRPRANAEEDDEADGDQELSKIQKSNRFGEALGRGTFKGTEEVEAREGPVQFEKDVAAADPFNVDKFLSEVQQSSTSKRGFGLQDEDDRQPKRSRVDDEDDD
ncbi:putative puff-specific nuclear protein Bx42 [Lasiosphaeria miniovina]|uniref:Pre-mRNA-processing protein 45 n=1 Tax=Lasiosphaeria miniovina TaxID=1954250 RepID=A0AA40B469_9PEZI|nr:putative puff-specific nuclear protein Bx42 [Lasiosphaeria miniovina]KAK0727332.1 putative puff-specific nuclear protein Bx42 [Lasiosphaeria miniovina]